MKRPLAPMKPPRSARGSAQARNARPLLGAFPLAVMTLATFLVLFTVTMARLKASADPVLRPSASLVARNSGINSGIVARVSDAQDRTEPGSD